MIRPRGVMYARQRKHPMCSQRPKQSGRVNEADQMFSSGMPFAPAGRMRLVFISLAVAGAWLCQPVAQTRRPPREHTIDVMVAPPIPVPAPLPLDSFVRQPPVLVAPHGPVKPTPVQIDAPQLDRVDYTAGDTFAFEVSFENVSAEPIRFPRWQAPEGVDRDVRDVRVAYISLLFEDDVLKSDVVGGQTLAGADAWPGSLIDVLPGDRVRIKGAGKWTLHRALGRPVPTPWARPLHLHASVSLYDERVWYVSERSKTAMEVRLRSGG